MASRGNPNGNPLINGNDSMKELSAAKKGRGGARRGAGRPKGSKSIFSMASVKKLEELGFDPIEKLVDRYMAIEDKLEETVDEKRVIKDGSQAQAQLYSSQISILGILINYGYRKVPEKTETEVVNKKPLAVQLTFVKGEDEEENDDK